MNKRGFTLVELILALFVAMVIMAAVYAAMNMAQRSSVNIGRKVVTQQDVRAVLSLMAMEIRMASYSPTQSTDWNPSCLALVPAFDKIKKGLQSAGRDNLVIEMDLNDPTAVPPVPADNVIAGNNEFIQYSYDAVAGTISRRTGCAGSLQPILGGAGFDTMVVNGSVVPAVDLFRYLDQNNNDITATVISNPTSLLQGIPAIRRIEITIVAETELADQGTTNKRRMVYSTNVLVRNHAAQK